MDTMDSETGRIPQRIQEGLGLPNLLECPILGSVSLESSKGSW